MKQTNQRNNAVQGQYDIYVNNSEYDAQLAFVRSVLNSEINTALLVSVRNVIPGGGAIGKVDLLPMVTQLDAQGNTISPGMIFNVPYFRYHGGNAAVILDPIVGDIGLAVFAKKDSSTVVAGDSEPKQPGSFRTFDMADGFYFGSMLAAVPQTFIRFNQNQTIDIVANSGVNVTGTITVNGDVIANGISLTNHVHSGVMSGGSTTSAPVR